MEMKRFALTYMVMGISCSISQVLLAREFMTVLGGNELILGVLFVNWLLCIALGSWCLGRLADRITRRLELLVIVLILVSIVLPLQILFVRSIGNWIVAERGEMAGLPQTYYSTFIALLPFCSLHGFLFALCCRLYPDASGPNNSATQISRVYVLEASGSVLGGLAFTYLLVRRFQVFEISVGLSFLNLLLALILIEAGKAGDTTVTSRRILTGITLILLVLGGILTLSGGLERLDASSRRWQWEGLGLVHSENSVYGNIAITQRGGQLDFWVNGLPLFTSPDPDVLFVEEVAHFPMLQHPSPGNVLLIGGGLGGVLDELLKHPVNKVTYVELDPFLIDLAKRHSPGSARALDDIRVDVKHVDGRLFVKMAECNFDVAIVNLPPPSTLQLNRFYSAEFFREIRRVLGDEGILSLSLQSSMTHMSEEMGNRNRCIHETIRRVFPSCLVVPGDYNIFIASPVSGGDGTAFDVDVLCQRLRDRGLGTGLFTEDYIRHKLSSERKETGLAYLQTKRGEVNRDMLPVAVFHDLALWNALFHPQTRALFSLLSNIELSWIVIPLVVVMVSILSLRRRISLGYAAVYFAIFTTGLAGMTLSIIMLYAFQALCGYLYQDLGVVSAAFMLGAALGGWSTGHMVSKIESDVGTLRKTESVMIAYSILAPLFVTFVSSNLPDTSILLSARIFLPFLNLVAGVFVGLEFQLASRIRLQGYEKVGGVAGAFYATDLIGACAGALMASIWLIPLHGVLGASVVVAMLKAVSLVLIYTIKRP